MQETQRARQIVSHQIVCQCGATIYDIETQRRRTRARVRVAGHTSAAPASCAPSSVLCPSRQASRA